MKHWKGIRSALLVIILVAVTALVIGCTEPPIASFTADKTTVAVGKSVQFSNSSTGEITSWSWDFGDGNTSTQENPSHAYAKQGNYTASLTVSNKAGSDTDTLAITVIGPPSAGFSASETKTKPGSSIQFTDDSSGDIDSWSWDFGDGSTSTKENPSHSYAERGQYTISLKVSNRAGTDKDTLVILVLEPVRANFSASEIKAIRGSTIQFTDQSSGDVDSWSWDFGDGSLSPQQNPSHTYEDAGKYTVSLTVSNAVSSDTRKKEGYITITSLLIISRIEICSDVTEDGDYTPQPDATFHVGDALWVYFEASGLELQETNGNYEGWVQWQQLKFYDPDGNILAEYSDISVLHETVAEKLEFEWAIFWLGLGEATSSDPLGEYRVEVKVKDNISGQTATESITFILE